MMDKNINAETADKLAGLQIDFLQKYRKDKITLEEFEKFLNLSQPERRKALGLNKENVSGNSILRLLSTESSLVIKATDGKRFLAKAKNTFKSFVDADFKNWELDKISHATADTPTNVYEMITDATFVQIFGSLSDDLDKLCLTQDQIEEFCLTHSDHLRADGYATLFLFKENENFFVAGVRVRSDGLSLDVYRLERDYGWHGDRRRRVVVPQL
jgi:hypothetical protein